MIILNEGNCLSVENELGILEIEDDIEDGMSFIVGKHSIALFMTALFTNDELKNFLGNQRHCIIKNSLQSKLIGKKKVLETIFSKVNIESGNEDDYKIMFFSEDTTYNYPLEKEEWDEMIKLITWVANGYN